MGGSSFSTSTLRRRSKNGFRMACKDATTLDLLSKPSVVCPSFISSKLNHCWNESRSSKISGRMKLRRDQSSARLFYMPKSASGIDKSQTETQTWRGVPVRIIRLALVYDLSSRISLNPESAHPSGYTT